MKVVTTAVRTITKTTDQMHRAILLSTRVKLLLTQLMTMSSAKAVGIR